LLGQRGPGFERVTEVTTKRDAANQGIRGGQGKGGRAGRKGTQRIPVKGRNLKEAQGRRVRTYGAKGEK